ncbi:MAG: hydratase, partial [Lachnospiraceae bacterium]|nr:hydratase [Lachnospiraceae bacterium]
VDLSAIRPMIAMPFHPSNVYPIHELKDNLQDILADCEAKAKVSLGDKVQYSLQDKVIDGKLYVEQGIIAGCAGGGYENICAAADILRGKNIGDGKFSLSVYPASTPIFRELMVNGVGADLLTAGAVLKTAFCGPCFGAGDTPANNALSIRHSTRNFPNREGSKVQNGQISSVALMDARSIAATAAAKGFLTGADELDVEYTGPKYHFESSIYANRVFDSKGVADPDTEIQFGPNIKDWPEMVPLTEDVLLRVVSVIHDPVTTTDELIPSGETSSYRSNPEALSQFALSRKDPAYVGRAKEIREVEMIRRTNSCPMRENEDVKAAFTTVKAHYPDLKARATGVGTTIYAVKPGDGSAREQAASCQKVLGGWANIAREYATKRYRSNLINWGMIPFILPQDAQTDSVGDTSVATDVLPFENMDFLFIPGIRTAITEGASQVTAYRIVGNQMLPFTLGIGEMTADERQIILDGCLINYYKAAQK